MAEAAIRVLYVGGLPRSGSTLTDLMLHQLPDHVGVGELFYLWRNGVEHDGLCACGAHFADCPFWTEVGDRAFGGWSGAVAARAQKLQAAVDTTARIPLLLARRRPRSFQLALDDYADLLRRLYLAVSAVSGCSVVVDSSKRPSLAYVLRSMSDVDLRVVHVVRDPRGVAYSFAKHVPLADGVALRDEMPRSATRKVARRWVTVNLLIGGLARLGVPVTRLRYEDVVAAPGRELERVLELSAVSVRPGALDFVSAQGVTVPKSHLIAAGRIRMHHGTVPLRLDDAWQRELSPRSRRLVDVVTAPLRRRYGYP